MKRTILLYGLSLFSLLISCGDDEDKKSVKYYVEFKMNGGELIRFEADELGYQACDNCACIIVPSASSDAVSLSACNETENFMANDIEDLDGTSLPFTTTDFPKAIFTFELDGVYYASTYADNQAGAFTVTNVTPDGTFDSHVMYKVTGEFECIVRPDLSSPDIAITDGKFIIRFSEN